MKKSQPTIRKNLPVRGWVADHLMNEAYLITVRDANASPQLLDAANAIIKWHNSDKANLEDLAQILKNIPSKTFQGTHLARLREDFLSSVPKTATPKGAGD